MDLDQLIDKLDIERLPDSCGVTHVVDVTDDSRTVMPGSLFVARPGVKLDGRLYIEQAVRDGAVAILTDRTGAKRVDTSRAVALVTDDVPMAAAHLAERFHGNPTSRLKLVGITGTNGKTTVAHLLHGILNSAGCRAGLVGTVSIDDGREIADAEMTTPGSIELSRTFATMIDAGCKAAVIEVSSHALDQHRAAGLSFDVGVFTTLGTDHMDYHHDRQTYLDAKRKLFLMLPEDGVAVANTDDPAWQEMTADCLANVVKCSMSQGDAVVRVTDRNVDRVAVEMVGRFGKIESLLPMSGDHNAMNLVQAVAVAHELGVDAVSITGSLAKPKLPRGRLEPVDTPGDVRYFIDFAHTPDALECTLSQMRHAMEQSGRSGKLWAVFGCGGHKDRTKRPVMGEIAGRIADRVVLTSDNPRSEPENAIISSIFEGIEPSRRTDVIQESKRELAIAQVVEQAEPGDVVVIAGKGHEKTQEGCDANGNVVVRPFDDAACVRACVRERALAR
jgi:UDP-N-acetylmuramoyl-L-alanyl-D-glutamate--2,6-diaminopimelate ligase